ncbi:MAG: hypothetical protein NPINA01_04890 [Nitrospinaceae bacterium]|nr:MAG: hypothetical protein NPINA01_04890 [Nitrospinaceae bacterium]
MANKRSFGVMKTLGFSLIPLIILVIVLELGLRVFLYQLESPYKLGLVDAYARVKLGVLKFRARKTVADLSIPPGLEEALYSKEGKLLFQELKNSYETHFKLLVNETKKINSRLIVLYIPSDNYRTKTFNKKTRNFFRELTQKYTIEFLDLTDEFLKWPVDYPTLLPENGHLSRFGNKLVVEALEPLITRYDDHRSSFQFENRPRLLGDLVPNENKFWKLWEAKPFRAITNSQGFRMSYDLKFPKEKQRILILGDSFTYGPYMGDHETYPAMLDKKFPDKEVINAAVLGYTIPDEVDLFVDRAKFVEPDITLLQVLDNDIIGLFFLKRKEFSRNKFLFGRLTEVMQPISGDKTFLPSELELEFLESINKKVPR